MLITSKLDYCNSLRGTMDKNFVSTQCARFEVLVLVHRAVNNCGSLYQCDLVSLHKSTRSLQSAEKHLLVRPRTRCKVGDVSFVAATPDMWNDLPVSRELTSEATFKRTLKTLYFIQYFNR